MADLPEPDDRAWMASRLTALVDSINVGESGLTTLQSTINLIQRACGGVGASFVEYGCRSGRVVSASGELTWSLGLPIDVVNPDVQRVLGQHPRVREFRTREIPTPGARNLLGHGIHRIVVSEAAAGPMPLGLVTVGYRSELGTTRPDQRAALAMLTALIATQYRLGHGLPVHADTPPVGANADGADPPDDERELFIALTGHELRTPVTVIRGYSDTLIDHWEVLDERARREAVTVVGQRARQLARLVDRLLSVVGDGVTMAGARTGARFDLRLALREGLDELSGDARAALRVELPPDLPKVIGDRAGIATVLTELVTNACKYSRSRVEVELTAGADAQTVWFRVADRGIGIRPEHVERAFERFWQLETGDQRTFGGVGLGLYLVRRIVERQQGWVSLRARPGGGAIAEVRLPRADPRDASLGEA